VEKPRRKKRRLKAGTNIEKRIAGQLRWETGPGPQERDGGKKGQVGRRGNDILKWSRGN